MLPKSNDQSVQKLHGSKCSYCKLRLLDLVGKKRNQCKFVRQAFEQQREYWKDDEPNQVVEEHIKRIVWQLDNKAVPLELLQEKNQIGKDPWNGYSPKSNHIPGVCFRS